MAIMNMVCYGGASLNFDVICNPKPETAKGNTIWVDTDTEITGWIFSAAEPESPADGENPVWFSTAANSSAKFNALKRNCIMVYPISAKQWIDGAWVSKKAESYQDGDWVEWLHYLYNFGDEGIDVTGGWTLTNASGGTSAKNEDHVYFSYSGSNNIQSYLHTKNKITFPFRGYKTLKARFDIASHFATSILGLTSVAQASRNDFIFSTTFDTTGNGVEVSVDISNASGDFYVSIYSGMKTSKLYEVWFE